MRKKTNRKEKSVGNHQRKLIHPAGKEIIYNSMQFSQAVQIGKMIWISGQAGMNEKFEWRKVLKLKPARH
ncbi:MAG: RidA family protein [Desulfobacteraceae bacterium]|jgi:enamine deaminase RidA (YjgF/YER057c/UK114 family)|nr:MAG: RidA family protein [Desulfobacteraceae bacterium]